MGVRLPGFAPFPFSIKDIHFYPGQGRYFQRKIPLCLSQLPSSDSSATPAALHLSSQHLQTRKCIPRTIWVTGCPLLSHQPASGLRPLPSWKANLHTLSGNGPGLLAPGSGAHCSDQSLSLSSASRSCFLSPPLWHGTGPFPIGASEIFTVSPTTNSPRSQVAPPLASITPSPSVPVGPSLSARSSPPPGPQPRQRVAQAESCTARFFLHSVSWAALWRVLAFTFKPLQHPLPQLSLSHGRPSS